MCEIMTTVHHFYGFLPPPLLPRPQVPWRRKHLLFLFSHSCPTLCNPMDCSKPGSSVLHYLLEFAQIHVHWDGDAVSSSAISFLFAFILSQHQSLFQWVGSLHQVAKVWDLQLQHQSFQWIVVQSLSCVWLFVSPWTAASQAPLSSTISLNTCPLGLWCYLTISSYANPLSFLLQSFPPLGSFPINWFFESGG